MSAVMLEGLTMRRRYTARLASAGGCLDYLGLAVSDGGSSRRSCSRIWRAKRYLPAKCGRWSGLR